MDQLQKGMLLIVSGPSGVGKGTLINRLLANDSTFRLSVSVTTRKPRSPDEKHGVSYHFISDEEYDKLLAQDAFIEQATVHGERYGTLKSEVHPYIECGRHVILDINTEGAHRVFQCEKNFVSVFVMPPSYSSLRSRLTNRGTESPDAIERRLSNAKAEIELASNYHYVVVNDDLERASHEFNAIALAEKCSTVRFMPTVSDERGGNISCPS